MRLIITDSGNEPQVELYLQYGSDGSVILRAKQDTIDQSILTVCPNGHASTSINNIIFWRNDREDKQ
jgi:hypothetical protein